MEAPPLSSEAFGRVLPMLVAAHDVEEIIRVLLDFLGAGFARVILLTHLQDEFRGRDARGDDLLVDAIRQIRIPSREPSMFSLAASRKTPHFGRIPDDTAVDRAFSAALGGVAGNILVLPVVVADRVPLVVFASGTSVPVDPRSLRELADCVSHALQRLIVARKSRGS
jgi:hypothetical protein